MQKLKPQAEEDQSTDLARRLERYRNRVALEGRKRSLKLIDRAIRDAVVGSGKDV